MRVKQDEIFSTLVMRRLLILGHHQVKGNLSNNLVQKKIPAKLMMFSLATLNLLNINILAFWSWPRQYADVSVPL